MDFFQKRWVRIVGLVPMSLYSLVSILLVYGLINDTVFRPPNKVFSMTDLIGWMGYLFFLSLLAGTGLLALFTAFKMGRIFKVLYIAGSLIILYAASYLPLNFLFTTDVEFYPDNVDAQFLIGKWMNDDFQLDLFSDSTYTLTYQSHFLFWGDSLSSGGIWRQDRHRIYFSNPYPYWTNPCEVTKSDGYYFITYGIPENFDAWTGDLGLMREKDWQASH